MKQCALPDEIKIASADGTYEEVDNKLRLETEQFEIRSKLTSWHKGLFSHRVGNEELSGRHLRTLRTR